MSSTTHPSADLSAYLDGALGAVERASVSAHLDACPECRRHLAELRATATLIARLHDPVPSRSLVPRPARVPAWLAPLRTLSAIASGVSVFVLVAGVLLGSMTQLASAPEALRAVGGAAPAVPAASGVAAAPVPTASSAERSSAKDKAAATASAFALNATSATPAPTATAAPSAAAAAQGADANGARESSPPQVPLGPWFWLVAAIATGTLAVALQRRLKSA